MEQIINPVVGKWQQRKGQPYEGLWYEFFEDGSYQTAYPAMGVSSSGRFLLSGDLIYIDRTQHSLGLVGVFEGRVKIEKDTLWLSIGEIGEKAPIDLTKARLYIRK